MRNGEVKPINGAWNEEANAWESEMLCLTGDCFLEVVLPGKGRIVIKKAEAAEGPFPKALVTKWGGPSFKIRIYGATEARYIIVCLTETPTNIQISSI